MLKHHDFVTLVTQVPGQQHIHVAFLAYIQSACPSPLSASNTKDGSNPCLYATVIRHCIWRVTKTFHSWVVNIILLVVDLVLRGWYLITRLESFNVPVFSCSFTCLHIAHDADWIHIEDTVLVLCLVLLSLSNIGTHCQSLQMCILQNISVFIVLAFTKT